MSQLSEPSRTTRPARTFRESYLDLVCGKQKGVVASLSRLGLFLLGLPYGMVVRVRNRLYDLGWLRVRRATVPVVSIGNLTMGGTGKTPCVEYVASFYRRHDTRVAILSRGYGASEGRNDEAMVLEENLPDVPHLQGSDRASQAAVAVEELESEVLVLDDGFQHRRLARDLDILLIDATDPWGLGYLCPRGLLREPRSGLRRAAAVLLTRCDQASPERIQEVRRIVGRLTPGAVIAETVHQPEALVNGSREASLNHLRDRPVAAFCGIGNPEAFRRSLLDLGAPPEEFLAFPDHHPYGREDVERLQDWASRLAMECVIVTTQKDLVKLRTEQLAGRELWALRIRLRVRAGQAEFDRKLESVLDPRLAATA